MFRRALACLLAFFAVFGLTTLAQANGDWRVGGAVGYGGTGINQVVNVDGTDTSVQRSEGPGIAAFFVDRPISNTFSLGVEYSSGFRLGPFSAGEFFAGVTGRWYYWGPAPSIVKKPELGSTLFIKRYTPYAGFSTGVAMADINRRNDQVPSVTGSGVYIGSKFGIDYPLGYNFGLLPEVDYSFTFYNSPNEPQSSLSEFSLQCGLYVYF